MHVCLCGYVQSAYHATVSVVLSFLVDTAVYRLLLKEHKLTSYSMRCVAK